MRLARVLAPIGAILFMAVAVPTLAQDWTGHGRVNGIVTDAATKKPISGAKVTLRQADLPDAGPEVITTNKKGHWSYLGLVGGNWTVAIEADGYVPSQGNIHVDEFHPNPIIQIALRPMSEVKPKENPKLSAAQKAIDQGDALLKDKKGAKALAEYQKALPDLEGDNKIIVLKRIATAQMISGDDAGAVETLKQVLVAKPDDIDALRLIIDRLTVLHRDQEAQQYVAQLPAGTAVDPNTLLNQGINDYNANKYPEALTKFQQVVATKPDWSDGYYYRGLAYLATGKTADAKADFQKVLELDPNGQWASECKEFLKSL